MTIKIVVSCFALALATSAYGAGKFSDITDKMTDVRTTRITVYAKEGNASNSFMFVCQGSKFKVIALTDSYLNSGADDKGMFRVDANPAVTGPWMYVKTMASPKDPEELLRQLKTASTLMVRLFSHDGDIHTYTFDVNGVYQDLGKLHCPVPTVTKGTPQ